VLVTHKAQLTKDGVWKVPMFTDDQGVWRTTHAIGNHFGAGYGGATMHPPRKIRNMFQLAGVNRRMATAPAGSEQLYLEDRRVLLPLVPLPART